MLDVPVLCYQTPHVAIPEQPAQFRLFKLKSGRTDGCAVDHDINAICARPECARAQVIDYWQPSILKFEPLSADMT